MEGDFVFVAKISLFFEVFQGFLVIETVIGFFWYVQDELTHLNYQ